MSKKSIKSSLFRFVTLRSPQLVEDKDTGFVSFNADNETSSIYYQAVNGAADEAARKTAIEGADSSLSKLEDIAALKALSEDLHTFSSWLLRNKKNLSYASIKNNIPTGYLDGSVTDFTLSTSEEVQVWDNLFYQTVKKVSIPVREGCLQLLVANKFVKEFKTYHDSFSSAEGEIVFNEEEENQFIKRANASVVIEKKILVSDGTANIQAKGGIPEATSKFLQDDLTTFLAKQRIETYQTALSELDKEEANYKKDSQKLYDSALATHNTDTQVMLDNVKVVTEVTDPDTGNVTLKNTYPGLGELPAFEFTPPVINFQTDTQDVYAKPTPGANEPSPISFLSQDTLDILKKPDFSILTEFSEVKNKVKECLLVEEEIVFNARPSDTKKLVVGGATVTTNSLSAITKNKTYCFGGALSHSLSLTGDDQFLISINMITNRDHAYIESSTWSLTNNANQQVTNGSGGSLKDNENQRVVYQFTPSDNSLQVGAYTLEGTFNFSNEDVVSFSAIVFFRDLKPKCGITPPSYFKGCGVLESSSNDGNENGGSSSETPLFGIARLGIGDYRRVEQEVCCYVPGEVSHIENVMKGEFKERKNRSLKRSENTFTIENERTTEQLKDTTSTDRYEMEQETSQIVQQDSSFDLGVTFNASGLNTSLSVNSNYATSTSTTDSDFQANSYAKEVTERALERVTERVREQRISKIIEEYEENNTHSLDNKEGEEHIAGLYRWVDKVYKNKVVNYGRRLMYEFTVPQPASYYLGQKGSNDETNSGVLTIPIDPRKEKLPSGQVNLERVATHLALNELNYGFWTSMYNVSINAPLPKFKVVSEKHLNKDWGSDHGRFQKADDFSIKVPEGYAVKSVKGYFDPVQGNSASTTQNMTADVYIGGKYVRVKASSSTNYPIQLSFNEKITEQLEVSLTSWDIGYYNFNLTVEYQLLDSKHEEWQLDTFNKIIAAYNTEKAKYDTALEDLKQQDSSLFSISGSNPLYYREIEKTELKKNCIYLLAGDDSIGKNFVIEKANKEMVPNNNEAFNSYSSFANFMEQAFDWKLMTYVFQPYFWGDKEDWTDLFSIEDNDNVFKAFLQSGLAKVVVPVRLGFEKAILHYLETGELWDGGSIPTIDSDLYTSIIDEMQEQNAIVEGDAWETRVPTALTILQARNAAIIGNGLPCYCDDYDPIGEEHEGVGSDIIEDDNVVT